MSLSSIKTSKSLRFWINSMTISKWTRRESLKGRRYWIQALTHWAKTSRLTLLWSAPSRTWILRKTYSMSRSIPWTKRCKEPWDDLWGSFSTTSCWHPFGYLSAFPWSWFSCSHGLWNATYGSWSQSLAWSSRDYAVSGALDASDASK